MSEPSWFLERGPISISRVAVLGSEGEDRCNSEREGVVTGGVLGRSSSLWRSDVWLKIQPLSPDRERENEVPGLIQAFQVVTRHGVDLSFHEMLVTAYAQLWAKVVLCTRSPYHRELLRVDAPCWRWLLSP